MKYTLCPPRIAAGTHVVKYHAAPMSIMDAGHISKMGSLVRWSPSVGEVTLVKIGPRKPTLATKLMQLKERFNA